MYCIHSEALFPVLRAIKMTDDSRRQKRLQINIEVTVIDFMTRIPIGRVVDLSESGMRVAANKIIMPDALFQFDLHFPKQYVATNIIRVGAQELWSVNNSQSNQYEIGFRFIDISGTDRTWIRNWVNELGSSYA